MLASLIAFELEADEQQRSQASALVASRRETALRDEFLASVAHDLKNPLTSIHGYTELLSRLGNRAETVPTARFHPYLTAIRRSAARMADSIDELMDITRLGAERSLELHRELVDVAALVREVAGEQQQGTDRHHIVVAGVATLVGDWDRARLVRVIQNLISNAVRYSPEGGEVTVAVDQQQDAAGTWARVQITDRGVGIPAADLPHIFEQFHRGSNVVGRLGGTGIGLFSVRHIVEQHGGTVAVESREGEGSTFTVCLPL